MTTETRTGLTAAFFVAVITVAMPFAGMMVRAATSLWDEWQDKRVDTATDPVYLAGIAAAMDQQGEQ